MYIYKHIIYHIVTHISALQFFTSAVHLYFEYKCMYQYLNVSNISRIAGNYICLYICMYECKPELFH